MLYNGRTYVAALHEVLLRQLVSRHELDKQVRETVLEVRRSSIGGFTILGKNVAHGKINGYMAFLFSVRSGFFFAETV